jgi:uncharacterized membrane protein (UPF0127 family)
MSLVAFIPRRALAGMLVGLALLAAPSTHAASSLKVEPLGILTARGAAHFKVEIADTDASRERGLMFRKSLAADRGMLFDFKQTQPVAFWMKNTLIPLDMLFIAADGRIVSIAHNAAPMSETPIPSGEPVLGVLEIRGGRADEIGAAPGDKVQARMFAR